MAKDPVCKMEVDQHTALGMSTYQGVTYYFCSPGCKDTFDRDPSRHLGKTDILGRTTKNK